MLDQPFLIDVSILLRFLRKKKSISGIPRVVLTYIEHYQAQCHLIFYSRILSTFVVLPQPISHKIIKMILQWNYKLYPLIFWNIMRYGKFPFFPEKKWAGKFYIKICMSDISAPIFFWQLRRMRVKLIVMIHDLIPLQQQTLVSPVSTRRFATGITSLLKHATGVITVSEVERLNLIDYCSLQGQAIPPSISSNLASGLTLDKSKILPRLVQEPYFVIIGPVSDRKNHRLLLNIWMKLVDSPPNIMPKLIIFGEMHVDKERELALLVMDPKLTPWVTQLQVTDLELCQYVVHAQALLIPSLAEGYGLPLIEALTLGAPVIANNLPVFYEIADDIPESIDVSDEKQWLEMIIDYTYPESSLRQAQLERLAHFKAPSWEAHFERVEHFLKDI